MGATAARIRRYGNRCLRRRAQLVECAAPETRDLLARLWRSLQEDGGVGLAAPQIGVASRVVVVLDPERPRGKQRLDLVNPEIRETFGPSVAFEEGCLSFPGLYTEVWRPQGVVVAYDGPDGVQVRREEGLASRIIQHEVDHLDGVLFIDHLSGFRKFMLWPRLLFYIVTEMLLKRSDRERNPG